MPTVPPSWETAYYQALLRQDLSSFIAKTFHTVNPATPFLPNWHIDAIAEYLAAAGRREITRLIINMPPRSLKSICVSVAWPAWLLGRHPATRIMAASYSQALSLKHALDCRLVVTSPWYQHLFPAMRVTFGQNEKHKFVTDQRGFRFATSIGGTATGEGGDILIVDDPHSPLQAASEKRREWAIEWFRQTFMSRLNDKERGVVVVVMQRLHAEDLSGYLLAHGGELWEHLVLPAIAEKEIMIQVGAREWQRPEGSILHPGREGEALLQRALEELGSLGFAAQYQQAPLPAEGGMVKASWFRRYPASLQEALAQNAYVSWDTAVKSGGSHDYSVCTVWAVTDTGYYLLDVFRDRLEYPELKRSALRLAAKWQARAILIEDRASGQALLQDMRREGDYPLIAMQPIQDKRTRFAAVTPLFEAGMVHFPEQASWLGAFESELLAFPAGLHDDQVDSVSQFLTWARERHRREVRIRRI